MIRDGNVDSDDKMTSVKSTHNYVKTLDHEFLGRIEIYQHYANQQLLIMKEKIANNQDHMRQEEALIEKRDMLRHPNLMILKDWSVRKDSKVCATFYTLRSYYLYHLENCELIAKRQEKIGTPLEDHELMQLVYDGIDVLSYLESQGYNHGFIRPELIARNEKKAFVLMDRLMEGSAIDSNKYARQMGFDPYCSPAVWNNITNQRQNPHDPYKDDAFSFGMVLLRMANLRSPREVYEPTGIVNQARLNDLIDKAATRYDHIILFRQVLDRLLAVDEKFRADASTIKSGLPNRQQIQMFFSNDNEDIFFDGPKSQLHNTMLGRESIMPYPVKNTGASNISRAELGTSNMLSGINRSGVRGSSRHNDDIFGKNPAEVKHSQLTNHELQSNDVLHPTGFIRPNTDPLAAKVPPLPVGPSASPALNSMPMGAPMMNRPGSLPSNSPLNNSLYTSNPMLPNTRDTYTNYTDSRILPSQPLQPGAQMPNPQMMPPHMAGSGFGGQLPPPTNQGFMGQGGQTFPQNNPSMGYPPMNPQMGGGAGIQGGYMVPGRNPYAAGQVGGQPMAMPPQQQLPPPPGYAPPAQVYVPGGVSAGGQMYSPTAAPRPAGNFY